ncbi:MAG: YscO family type III secretion system apparatus protein [Ramlibacter sp.]
MEEFQQLVTVKAMREEKADRKVQVQRRALQAAQDQRDAADVRLQEFRAYSDERERRMYQGLCERIVQMRDIDEVHRQVQVLRARESDHYEELQTAEAQRERESNQLDEDRTAHRLARRVRDKFVELGDIFAAQARTEAERAEDAEIEEAAGTRRPSPLTQECA